ncbi:hypothetical protein KRZ98_06160 [Sphingobium sp. AS12]|uniref:hypothetical protein n=1 Tax=Sphingobium sp. AS12 TaxID=2849495 RepID=UPI001C31664D|nr:hypothetical protein [Sphingobium sp. AS12]MBV2147873.1 hypothetical protein [Sphingobium sp. AS12]
MSYGYRGGYSVGYARRSGGGGAPAPALLPVGSTYNWVGDGLVAPSGGVGPGANNAPHVFQALMSARVQPTAVPFLALSGTSISDQATGNVWIDPMAIDAALCQYPDLMMLGPMGANDNLLSTNPGANPASGSTSNPYLQDWYDAVDRAFAEQVVARGKHLVVIPTVGSAKAGEATVDSGQTLTRRERVWAAMAAHVGAMTATTPKCDYVDLAAMVPASSYSVDSPLYVHVDERGSWAVALPVFTALDGKVEAKTAQEIRDMIEAGTYPLMASAQLDTDRALAGTGGTITGPGVTAVVGSGLATSKSIINDTGATGITVAQVATTGGRTKTVVTLAGTASATSRIRIADKSNFTVTASPGQYVRTGAMMRCSAGYYSFGSQYSYGTYGGGGGSLGVSGLIGAANTHAFDALVQTNEQALYGAGPSYPGARNFAFSWRTGASLSGTIEIEQPYAYLVSDRDKGLPVYLGELQNGAGGLYFSSNFRMGLTGAVSAASGGSPVVRPGTWNLRGFTNSDFVARRIYKGGTAGQTGIGTGTLLATLSGSTWTASIAGGATTAGDLLYVEVDCNNGIGPTVTYRSVLAVTVGA